MIRNHSLLILGLIALCALAPVASAQAPFSIRVQLPQSTTAIADGSTVAMQADAIGAPVSAQVTITYTGSTTANINGVDYSGANDFSLNSLPDFSASSLTLVQNQTLSFGVRYAPATSNKVSGRISIPWMEGGRTGTLTINLTGAAPEFVFSYIPQGGNQTQIAPGGTITAALTSVGATSNTVVVITNKGSGPGVINGITASGGAFALAGLPLPQTIVDTGKELRFTVAFTPADLEVATGAVQIALFNTSVSFNLAGQGSGPAWAYETIQDSTFSAILAGQPISLPDAVVGDKSSTITVRVKNVGNADGQITQINVSGQGFTLSDKPFTPLTLAAAAAATVTVTFTPTQAGRASGRLQIGSDTFEISGNGLGSSLQYAYVIGSASIAVQTSGQVSFTPVAVGGTSNVRFTVNNNGTAPTSIGSISIVQTGTVFALTQLPALPVTIQSGGVFSFQLGFTPTTMGASTATLKLDTQTFTLSGTGNTPAALSAYRFDGPAGPQDPMTQPAVGLSLAQAYPLALTGTLTMNFYSEVGATDPAVQFATGGRTLTFTIPANSTQAIFPNSATQVRVQTGSVAGAITLTPSFQTLGGNIDLTPLSPASFSITVPQSAPRLLGVSVTGKTAGGFSLLITGLATGRSVTQLDFTFTPTAGETVATTKLTLPVESSFLAWFSNTAASQPYGSLFTATVPFTMAGDVSKVTSVVDTIQSVSVTITNRLGTSASQSVNLK